MRDSPIICSSRPFRGPLTRNNWGTSSLLRKEWRRYRNTLFSSSSMGTRRPSSWLPLCYPTGVCLSCTRCYWSQSSTWATSSEYNRRNWATTSHQTSSCRQPWRSLWMFARTRTNKPTKWSRYWVCYHEGCRVKWCLRSCQRITTNTWTSWNITRWWRCMRKAI